MQGVDDLIKRSDAIKAVSKVDDYGDGIGFEVRNHCLVELELVPSADRPQGEWIVNISDYKSVCSVCGANETHFIYGTEMWYGLGKSKFCPYCGAKMKGA